MARKTKTSSEVKQRWEARNYQKYAVRLRKDTDADLIAYLDANKEAYGTTEPFRRGLALLVQAEKEKGGLDAIGCEEDYS